MGRRGGCLAVLVILALGGIVLSLLLPPTAAGLVTLGLEAAGLRADRLVVSVEADPPLRLLVGRADRVVVDGTEIRWGTTSAASLALVLVDVDLVGRRAASLDGQLLDVRTADGPAGPVAVASVAISGPGSGPDARATVAPAEASRVVRALAGSVGLAAARVVLEAPDRVLVTVGGRTLEARLGVAEGAVVVAGPAVPRLVVLAAGSVGGVRVQSVRIGADGEIVVEGRLAPAVFGLAP